MPRVEAPGGGTLEPLPAAVGGQSPYSRAPPLMSTLHCRTPEGRAVLTVHNYNLPRRPAMPSPAGPGGPGRTSFARPVPLGLRLPGRLHSSTVPCTGKNLSGGTDLSVFPERQLVPPLSYCTSRAASSSTDACGLGLGQGWRLEESSPPAGGVLGPVVPGTSGRCECLPGLEGAIAYSFTIFLCVRGSYVLAMLSLLLCCCNVCL